MQGFILMLVFEDQWCEILYTRAKVTVTTTALCEKSSTAFLLSSEVSCRFQPIFIPRVLPPKNTFLFAKDLYPVIDIMRSPSPNQHSNLQD
jgi:hypothetical protein